MPRKTQDCEQSTSSAYTSKFSIMDEDMYSDEEISSSSNSGVLVNNFVKYILNNSLNKYPIKRNEMIKQLGITQKSLNNIFSAAKTLLKDIYGIELKEITEKSVKSYITLPTNKLLSELTVNDETATELKTLFIVLSYIFMKSGEVQEASLNRFLDKLYFNMDEFSKVKDKFVKQLYLKRQKIEFEGQKDHQIHYSWGERASLEFSKSDILEAVAKLLNKPASNFFAQYREAYGEDPSISQASIMIR